MLVVVLMLALQLLRSVVEPGQTTPAPPPVRVDTSDAREKIAELRSLLGELQEQVSEQANEMENRSLAPSAMTIGREMATLKEREKELEERTREVLRGIERISPLAAGTPQQEYEALTSELQRKGKEKTKLEEEVNNPEFVKRVFFKGPPQHEKTPILIEYSSSKIRAIVLGEKDQPPIFNKSQNNATGPNVEGFLDWLKNRNPGKEYVVFLVKPSAVPSFYQVRSLVKSAGFDVGWEPLAEDRTAEGIAEGCTGK